MALVVVRSNVSKIIKSSTLVQKISTKACTNVKKPICKINENALIYKQRVFISGKAFRDKDLKKPAPYPYKQKRYRLWNAIFDRTTHRLDENSKIIVVEGPIAAGKSDFAKKLADDLDFHHISEASMDDYYLTSYGLDLRELDPQLPESCRSYDEKDFARDPHNSKAASFQIQTYQMRYFRYVDALAHLLNTGQGVVIERCPYSDFVFLEAMFESGYVSKGARRAYYEVKDNTIQELMKPHLIIYLDVPVPSVKDRIIKRNRPYEIQSKVFTNEYLHAMENVYKTKYLKEISEHAELLVYDWSQYGDVEVVVEDIERIKFEGFDKYDSKMKDWRIVKEWDWADRRARYTNNKGMLLNFFNVPILDVPELLVDAGDLKEAEDVFNNTAGLKYREGFNADAGDKGLLFKTGFDHTKIYR